MVSKGLTVKRSYPFLFIRFRVVYEEKRVNNGKVAVTSSDRIYSHANAFLCE